ncbi:MAG: hypothetical protein LBG04_03095 [Holosporaceae bacterium]|jgi:hypothetical protein|nr:hypothetical protein [Holosporaceae bacterium]
MSRILKTRSSEGLSRMMENYQVRFLGDGGIGNSPSVTRHLDENSCLFTAMNKDTSELYHELIPFDTEAAQRYSDRAVQIIKASENNELMPCVSSDPSFYRCKMCGFRNECWGDTK